MIQGIQVGESALLLSKVDRIEILGNFRRNGRWKVSGGSSFVDEVL